MENKYLIIDFDSTFVTVESLDELSKIALLSHPEKDKIVSEIAEITRLGMEGKIGFTESLQKRLALFSCNRGHIDQLVDLLSGKVTNSFIKNKEFIRQNSSRIYIVSGGFKEFIIPVVKSFGITSDQVLANEFLFKKNEVVGCNPNICLSQTGGKIQAVKDLNLDGQVIVIGDGITDYQIKEAGVADYFFAFVENIKRENVVSLADKVLNDMEQLREEIYEK